MKLEVGKEYLDKGSGTVVIVEKKDIYFLGIRHFKKFYDAGVYSEDGKLVKNLWGMPFDLIQPKESINPFKLYL